MLLFHIILTNYEKQDAHPIAHGLLHWLACGALNLAMWVAIMIAFVLIAK